MNINFEYYDPIFLAFLATLFTWFITSLGSLIVVFFKNINKNLMDCMLSISGGIMLSAAFFSLILPSINLSNSLNLNPLVITSLGFIIGGIFVYVGNYIYQKKSKNKVSNHISLLVFSITLHNIPEGLAIGVAFGSVLYNIEGASITAALLLALGIAIQNFPEGSAISLPLRREGYSRKKAFSIGCLSGIVEPISGVIGACLAIKIQYILPFLLAFAGGAMIYVVTLEIIPESQTNKKKDLMALCTILGFTLMMILDVAFG